ncbi:hypothetical protein F4820DRAFT_461741 [Hypoxylon rubiginosum]|uniref:Uncharacterized protein n=1 Tax=Hypoxylon rubiginosum TaxID=110542 RepID=A0ACB9YME8_9PEZI|nr:hypothetical protein F4820DRAFT_461741 [Hypoxylon rubiginosum]
MVAKFDYPYKKGVNITAWVLQFLVCIILLGASAWLLWLVDQSDYDSSLSDYEGLFTAAAGLQIAITLLNIIFNIVEIVLISRKSMPPALYLSFACIKTTIWGIIFILNLISLSVISIILSLILLATSLMQLIYGAILVHRKRKGTLRGGNYAPAANPQGSLEAGGYGGAPPQPGYYYPPPNASTEYKPTTDITSSPAPPYGFSAQDTYAPQAHGGSYELDSRVHHS